MVDIKTTQRSAFQRKYGAHSILSVCKEIRELATKAMFRHATFVIPHSKLHGKHRRENKMTTLHKIQHLVLLWTPAPSANFTTKRGDDAYVLAQIDHLRSLQVWLLASQHLRLHNISQIEFMSRVEVEQVMLAKFEPSIKSQPRWLKRLLRDAPKKFEDIDISLVGFFAFGPDLGVDLTAARISWPGKTINHTETVKWADRQRAREGLVCKRLRKFLAHASPSQVTAQISHTPYLAQDKMVMRPSVGDRTFGRKIY